jgi:hypothetical protein
LAVKEGEDIPKLDYTYGYLQTGIPVEGNIQKLNENLLNIGLWKIDEKDVQIQVGDTAITCNEDGTFSGNELSCVLAKNIVIDTMVNSAASIPSVDKVFVNRGLTIERTEGGNVTVLEDQQLVGHQYGAGGANSGKERRKQDFNAESIVTSIIPMASKLATVINNITIIGAATSVGLM